jgi:hypothetical protein
MIMPWTRAMVVIPWTRALMMIPRTRAMMMIPRACAMILPRACWGSMGIWLCVPSNAIMETFKDESIVLIRHFSFPMYTHKCFKVIKMGWVSEWVLIKAIVWAKCAINQPYHGVNMLHFHAVYLKIVLLTCPLPPLCYAGKKREDQVSLKYFFFINLILINHGRTVQWKTTIISQKPTRACVVLLFKMPTINKTYLILSYLILS